MHFSLGLLTAQCRSLCHCTFYQLLVFTGLLHAALLLQVAARSMLKGFKVDNSSAEQGQEQTDRFMALVVPERIPDSLLAEAEDGCVGAVLTSVG